MACTLVDRDTTRSDIRGLTRALSGSARSFLAPDCAKTIPIIMQTKAEAATSLAETMIEAEEKVLVFCQEWESEARVEPRRMKEWAEECDVKLSQVRRVCGPGNGKHSVPVRPLHKMYAVEFRESQPTATGDDAAQYLDQSDRPTTARPPPS